jgi:hypothetical protein
MSDWEVMSRTATAYQCPMCAALTQDVDKHKEWHVSQNPYATEDNEILGSLVPKWSPHV